MGQKYWEIFDFEKKNWELWVNFETLGSFRSFGQFLKFRESLNNLKKLFGSFISGVLFLELSTAFKALSYYEYFKDAFYGLEAFGVKAACKTLGSFKTLERFLIFYRSFSRIWKFCLLKVWTTYKALDNFGNFK